MKEIIDVLQGQEIHHEIGGCGYETIEFDGDMDVDCDGTGGNPHHDPYFQADTALHYPARPNVAGRALCAEKIRYVVVPPVVIKKTRGIVLGSLCEVTYNNKTVTAVVGDVGPTRKVGEGSCALLDALGVNSNPNTGGIDTFNVHYKIHVGVPAIIDGVTYQLQKASAGF